MGPPDQRFLRTEELVDRETQERRERLLLLGRYLMDAYPRSKAAREIMDSYTIIVVARNSPETDICRSLIDLDRCLFLQENGYDVMYREELFFAHRRREESG